MAELSVPRKGCKRDKKNKNKVSTIGIFRMVRGLFPLALGGLREYQEATARMVLF